MTDAEILQLIEAEVSRADEKHGPGIEREPLPMYMLGPNWTWHADLGVPCEVIARSRLDYNTITGREHSWLELLICELSESVSAAGQHRETGTEAAKAHLTAELSQVAALCVKAIRSLNRQ